MGSFPPVWGGSSSLRGPQTSLQGGHLLPHLQLTQSRSRRTANDTHTQLWSLTCPQTHHWSSWPQLPHLSRVGRLRSDCVPREDGCARDSGRHGSVGRSAFSVEVARTRPRLPPRPRSGCSWPPEPPLRTHLLLLGPGAGTDAPAEHEAARAVGCAGFPAPRTRCRAGAPSPETAGPRRLCPHVPSPGKPRPETS